MSTFDILVAGTAGVDTCVYLPSSDIDFSREASFTKVVDQPGGAGFYVASGLANLGFKVLYLGYLGEDTAGDMLSQAMAEAGVECHWLVDPEGTRRSVNLMRPDGSRKVFYDPKGAIKVVPENDLLMSCAKSSKHAVLCIENWVRNLIPCCKSAGIEMTTDLHDASDPNDSYRLDFVRACSTIFSSTSNIADLPEFHAGLREINPSATVVYGMGEKGAALARPQENYEAIPAVKLDSPIAYSNGAGDMLLCGSLAARFHGDSWENAVHCGQTLARHAIGQSQMTDKFLTWEQLKKLSGLS